MIDRTPLRVESSYSFGLVAHRLIQTNASSGSHM